MSWTTVFLVFIFCLSSPGSVTLANGQGQVTSVKVLEGGGDGQCPSVEERERARNEIRQIVASVVTSALPTTTASTTVPSTTTSAMTTPTTVSTMTDCGGPGWRRVAFINMTDTRYNCPTGLRLTPYSKRTCGASHTAGAGCSSTTFSTGGLVYSRVCGRIRGYQVGSDVAFHYASEGINSFYVSGVSLTHGRVGNRQHIWTFAAGLSEVTMYPDYTCPCDTAPVDRVPSFVGNDYFCESGLHSEWDNRYYGVLFPDDVLWDGQNCTSNSMCCQFNDPPWFTKNLPTATTDDIELRICYPDSPSLGDVPLELIELYVQ